MLLHAGLGKKDYGRELPGRERLPPNCAPAQLLGQPLCWGTGKGNKESLKASLRQRFIPQVQGLHAARFCPRPRTPPAAPCRSPRLPARAFYGGRSLSQYGTDAGPGSSKEAAARGGKQPEPQPDGEEEAGKLRCWLPVYFSWPGCSTAAPLLADCRPRPRLACPLPQPLGASKLNIVLPDPMGQRPSKAGAKAFPASHPVSVPPSPAGLPDQPMPALAVAAAAQLLAAQQQQQQQQQQAAALHQPKQPAAAEQPEGQPDAQQPAAVEQAGPSRAPVRARMCLLLPALFSARPPDVSAPAASLLQLLAHALHLTLCGVQDGEKLLPKPHERKLGPGSALPDGPEPAAVDVEYPAREALEPAADPSAALEGCLAGLEAVRVLEGQRGVVLCCLIAAQRGACTHKALMLASEAALARPRPAVKQGDMNEKRRRSSNSVLSAG